MSNEFGCIFKAIIASPGNMNNKWMWKLQSEETFFMDIPFDIITIYNYSVEQQYVFYLQSCHLPGLVLESVVSEINKIVL